MPQPASARSVRVGRAGAASALAVLVTLAAHLAGGGSAPPPGLLVAVVALAWPVAVLLIGARPRLWRQAAVIGLAQLLLHGVFAIGVVALPASGAPGSMSGMPGMHEGHPLTTSTFHAMAGMWGWHLVAWLLTVTAWRWGERVLHELVERLPAVARIALLAPVDLPAPARRTPPLYRLPRPLPVALDGRPRRGPPQGA